MELSIFILPLPHVKQTFKQNHEYLKKVVEIINLLEMYVIVKLPSRIYLMLNFYILKQIKSINKKYI